MKKHAKRLSIILTLALILTSFEFMSVFADGTYTITWKDGNGKVLCETQAAQGETPVYPSDAATPTKDDDDDYSYTFSGEWDPPLEPATGDTTYVAKFTAKYKAKALNTPQLSTYSSYNSVRLEWSKVDNPNKEGDYAGATVMYRLYCGGSVIYEGSATSFHHKNLNPLSTYSYRIQAYLEDKDLESALSGYTYDSPVRSMRYRITIKRAGTLKSHAGRKQKLKVKKGQVIYADRFQTGKYIFDYNGSTFYVARTRVGKKAAEYIGSGGSNYTRREAEWYVKDRGLSSGTGVMVWVSTFTQHVYYFRRGAAGWTCVDDWECSTGTASTPTPSGTNGMKAIKKKIKKKNGIKWWSTFNGNAALHGRKKNKPVGNVASNGCVRNPDEKAYVIFSQAGKGSRVLIY